jgi:hypothetical protein
MPGMLEDCQNAFVNSPNPARANDLGSCMAGDNDGGINCEDTCLAHP